MSLTKRSKVVLNSREHNVLVDLLKGMDVDTSQENLGISRTSLVHTRRRLREKFSAHSVIHLMVLAILEKKYYEIMSEGQSMYSEELNEREVYMAQQVLLGIRNKEIAELSYLSVRTIEDYRDSFNKKCGVKNSREFVKACLDNGILKLIPFQYRRSTFKDEGRTFKTFDQSLDCFYVAHEQKHVNQFGFVYFDYQNRFVTFESENVPLYTYIQMAPLVFSLILSEIPLAIIESITDLPPKFVSARSKEYKRQIISRGGCLGYLELLSEMKFYQPVIEQNELGDVIGFGKRVVLETIDQFSLQLNEADDTKGNERDVLKKQFNCYSDLTTIAQAIHLNMLSLGTNT
mmetsp:Transcript_33202/g.43718  ORF Transcript_33202/g.43718 Transcript_33202/m.43718 type:complete len:346 (-) Transcript_33202:18-1055(-)